MKLKLTLAVLLASGSIAMVFAAAKVETCAEKYKTCGDGCTNEQYHCKTRGADPAQCEMAYKKCMNKCDKAKADCEKTGKKP